MTNGASQLPPVLDFKTLNASPHQVYDLHRKEFPFVRRQDGVYIILRAKDIARLPSDPRTRQPETELLRSKGISQGPLFDLFANSMLFSNGDVHRSRRHPVSRAFAFRLMEESRPKVRKLIDSLLQDISDKTVLRIRDEYASLIPALTIAGILGIEQSDVSFFTSLAYDVSKVLTTSWTASERPLMEAAATDLIGYVNDLLAARRATPGSDFLSRYIAETNTEESLSAVETIMQIVSVILGGSDTTRGAIVIQTGLLLDDRDRWHSVHADLSLIPAAVMEALRYEPAIGSFPRFATEEIELDGHVIPAGSLMIMATISGMRDPEVYHNPHTFELTRQHPRWHPVFGSGEHRCLGEALARIELEEALAGLLSHYPEIRVIDEPLTVYGHAGIRRVSELKVALR
jgi:cytochrome P450